MTETALTVEVPTPTGSVTATLPEPSCELSDGRTGYFQTSTEDCLTAAVKTATQLEDVPAETQVWKLWLWLRERGWELNC